MKRTMILSASISALLATAVLAQQPQPPEKPYPNPTEIVPTPPSPPAGPSVPPALTQTPGSAGAQKSSMPASGEMTADTIQGMAIYTPKPGAALPPDAGAVTMTVTKDEYSRLRNSYQSIGEINDLVISSDGRVNNAVLSVGGFLGVGERHIAVQWSDIRFVRTADGETFAFVNRAKADLEKLPEYRSALK